MKKNGFTLVELMIAIAVLSIVLTLVSPLFKNIIKQQETTSRLDKIDKDLTRTAELIKRTMRASEFDVVELTSLSTDQEAGKNTVNTNIPFEVSGIGRYIFIGGGKFEYYRITGINGSELTLDRGLVEAKSSGDIVYWYEPSVKVMRYSGGAWDIEVSAGDVGQGIIIRDVDDVTMTTIYYDSAAQELKVNDGVSFNGGNTLLKNVSNVEFKRNDKGTLIVMNMEVTLIEGDVTITRAVTETAFTKALLRLDY